MFLNQIALVSQSNSIAFPEVCQIASALQKQITRDFTPIWNIPATIDAFSRLNDVPPGYWPILIRDNIGYAGAAGIHLDSNGQPFALVQASNDVALTCSHELLEMLTDPFGMRMVASKSVMPDQGRVKYLVEVCDPSESEEFAYTINGILVSDFYTPNYFDPITNSSVRYSYTGAIKQPREILKGGYLSWMIPETGEWWQANFFGNRLSYKSLGVLARKNGGWRELIDKLTFEPVEQRLKNSKSTSTLSFSKSFLSDSVSAASLGWANKLTLEIDELLAAK